MVELVLSAAIAALIVVDVIVTSALLNLHRRHRAMRREMCVLNRRLSFRIVDVIERERRKLP